MVKLRLSLIAMVMVTTSVSGQVQYQYTNTEQGPTNFRLGYPVPVPMDSVTPFDGFRSYASLHVRHQDLMLQSDNMTGQITGQTHNGRDIWAYILGDADDATVYGTPESATLTNANIHAREWQTAETSTAIIETLINNQDDQYLHQYLLENVNWVIVPVLNVDGLLQTQRYYDTALVGLDPTSSGWPRDGRMRRKNMPNVDEVLATTADHLGGIDLNRNFPPYWASTSSSSGNPNSLVYHGVAPLSEPESIALLAAADLAPTEQLRWYEDIHSFSLVTFSKRTSIFRRNALQSRLLTTFRVHNAALSAQRGWFRNYQDVPDPVDVGIGVTPDYFAATFQIPAWTLEIEPTGQGGLDYNGLGAEHDGFILPESQIDRVRTDLAASHMMMAYQQAGPPSVSSVKIIDEALDVVIFGGDWVVQSDGTRLFVPSVSGPLVKGRSYKFWIAFDKPMRWRENGEVANLPGVPITLQPEVSLVNPAVSRSLPTFNGQWLDQPGSAPDGYHQYKDDAFSFSYRVPAMLPVNDGNTMNLGVQAVDMVAQQTDADPSTPVDWQGGGWQGYEGHDGVNGDVGGTDLSIEVSIADEFVDQVVVAANSSVQEGSVQQLVVSRVGEGDGAVSIELAVSGDLTEGVDLFLSDPTVEFADGELGERLVTVVLPDNLEVDGERTFSVEGGVVGGAALSGSSGVIQLVDNDTESLLHYSVFDGAVDDVGTELDLHSQLAAVIPTTRFASAPVSIHLPADQLIQPTQPVDTATTNQLYATIRHDVTIHGNGSTLVRDESSIPYRFFSVHASGSLALHDIGMSNGMAPGKIGGAITNRGDLLLDNVYLVDNEGGKGGALWSRGPATLNNVVFDNNQAPRAAAIFNGLKTITADGLVVTNSSAGKEAIFVRELMVIVNGSITDNVMNNAAVNGVGELHMQNTTLERNTPRSCRGIAIVDNGDNVDIDGTCLP
ncbi:MAG: hypothetical protein DHS20C11_22540 [Lysobacteraceae bacterium]|nr:MAG: hypothetical protein DHS20C11_22540 [Xanthomonadaceae bacterium]